MSNFLTKMGLIVVLAATGLFSYGAFAAEHQKIISATGTRGWTAKATKAEYKRTVQVISDQCGSWGGRIQAGSDMVAATVPSYFVTAAICNY